MNDGVVEPDGHDVSDGLIQQPVSRLRRKDFHFHIGVSFSRKSFVSAAPPCASSALASFHTSTTVVCVLTAVSSTIATKTNVSRAAASGVPQAPAPLEFPCLFRLE